MLNGKSWAIFAAAAAVAIGGVAQAESNSAPTTTTDQLSLSQPTAFQAAPARKPLMWGLNEIGLAKPLDDLRIDIGGFVEASTTYYADPVKGKPQPGRGFDSENEDPTLNQLDLYIERTVDASKGEWDIGGRMEWIYGADARFIHSTGLFDHDDAANGPNNQFDPVQAYVDVAIPLGTGLRVRGGKFVTPAGVETINPTTTPLYSRGLLFTYLLPFTHTGVIAQYNITDQLMIEGGVIRGWDDAFEDKNADGVSGLGHLVYTSADKKSNYNVVLISGPENANDLTTTQSLVDFVWNYKYSDDWSFSAEGDFLWVTDIGGTDGFAGGDWRWATYKWSEYLAVMGRLEYLYDGQGFRFSGVSNNVYSATLGLDITPFPTDNLGSGLHIRPSMRYDYAQTAAFGGDNNQLTFAIEGYFAF